MSQPRLIETEKFLGCQDRDSSKLGNLMDVGTETSRDWAKDVDTETLISESLPFQCQHFIRDTQSPTTTQNRIEWNQVIGSLLPCLQEE